MNPNTFLDTTISMIKVISASKISDPRLLTKIEKIRQQAVQAKNVIKTTFTGNVDALKKYKMNQSKLINRRMVKALSTTELSGGVWSGTNVTLGLTSQMCFLLDGVCEKSNEIDRNYSTGEFFVSPILARLIVLITFLYLYNDASKIVRGTWNIFFKNKTKEFLNDSVHQTPTYARNFLNICLLSGLSKQSFVADKLILKNKKPALINDLISGLKLTNKDLSNVKLLPKILMCGYVYLVNTGIVAEEELYFLICTCMGIVNVSILAESRDAFIIKSKIEYIMALSNVNPTRQDFIENSGKYIVVLRSIRKSLDSINVNMHDSMPKKTTASFKFVYDFISNAESALQLSNH